jgi:energy-coupling factor transport system ATP-binding protein
VGRKIGYLFQNPDRQLFALSVREELAFALRLQGIDQAIVDQRVSRVLDRFQLGQMEGRLPQRLSQGEKQRLALAAVMLQQPEYLILDEPTSSLDDTRRRQLSRELKALREAGIGMLIITHDQSLVGEHAERILRLQAGRVISDETASP